MSIKRRVTNAGEARAASAVRDENGKMIASGVTDADHPAGQEPAKTPKKPRIPTEVAKQAAVSERRVQACAAIRRESPEAYQRIVKGKSTIREAKAAINKAIEERSGCTSARLGFPTAHLVGTRHAMQATWARLTSFDSTEGQEGGRIGPDNELPQPAE